MGRQGPLTKELLQKNSLLEDESVVAYLENTKTTEADQGNQETADEPEDFS